MEMKRNDDAMTERKSDALEHDARIAGPRQPNAGTPFSPQEAPPRSRNGSFRFNDTWNRSLGIASLSNVVLCNAKSR